jgi:hypothetical protein
MPADTPQTTPALSKQHAKLLRLAAGIGPMYPGTQWDLAPAQFTKLSRRGLVDDYQPHNPVHKQRAVITAEGRQALAAWEAANGRAF